MNDNAYMDWKWCSKCRHLVTTVEHHGMVNMGIDSCNLTPVKFERLTNEQDNSYYGAYGACCHPNVLRERQPMPSDCPYRTEAFVEQLNSGVISDGGCETPPSQCHHRQSSQSPQPSALKPTRRKSKRQCSYNGNPTETENTASN